MQRGKSGGFRVLAYYREENKTVYPFFIYSKKEYEKYPGQQPPRKDIVKWLTNLTAAFPAHYCPQGAPACDPSL
jgi:hypothetical protein